VDLFQLHHPDPDTPLEETLAALDQAVKQGKARHVGVSNHYAWQSAYMLAIARERRLAPIVSIQLRYNLLDRVAETETFAMAQRLNLAVMAYAPLCGGILTGKYRRGETKPAGTRSAGDAKVQRLLSQNSTFGVLDKLKEIAAQQGVELSQLAWLWLLSKPQVTTPILGGSTPEHFRSLYAIADRRLLPDVMQQLDEITSAYVHRPWHNQPESAGPPV
jgi:aryl-alcohol dehydrogenase-like predicted oxidoreductase